MAPPGPDGGGTSSLPSPSSLLSLTRFEATVADLITRMFDPAATIADVAWLRQAWLGPLVVKGVPNAADAKEACIGR